MKKTLTYNLIGFLLVLCAVEAFWGDWMHHSPFSDLRIRRNVVTNYDVSKIYKSPQPVAHIARDQYGFRGSYPNPSQIDVITLGGSTTEQAYISDGQTWQDTLAACASTPEHRISVVNAGVDGQTTFGHQLNFDLWFKDVPGFKPRFVLLNVGVNDRYVTPATAREYDQLELHKNSLWMQFKYKSALMRLARGIYGAISAHGQRITHGTVDFNQVQWTVHAPLQTNYAFMQPSIEAYMRRLLVLTQTIRSIGATPIFVTQLTRFYKKQGDHVVGAKIALSEVEGHELNTIDDYNIQDLINQKTLEVCASVGGICIDLAHELHFEDSDFYDWAHNNPEGTGKIGRYLCSKLKPTLLKESLSPTTAQQ